MSLSSYYHVHYDDDNDGSPSMWFETAAEAWRFVHGLDEKGIPVGYPVGSGTKCNVCRIERY